jgi:hypothetical protein
MWTINDFSTYADLFGWPTRGAKACPYFMHSIKSKLLKHSRKFCYRGRIAFRSSMEEEQKNF